MVNRYVSRRAGLRGLPRPTAAARPLKVPGSRWIALAGATLLLGGAALLAAAPVRADDTASLASGATATPTARCAAGFEQVSLNGFGDANNRYAWSMKPFQGRLYVGTLNQRTGAQIWRFDGENWQRVVAGGLNSRLNMGVRSLTTCNGMLFAGTDNEPEGAQLWRSSNGVQWEEAFTGGLDDPAVRSVRALQCLANGDTGFLYVGMMAPDRGARIYRTADGGDTFEPVVLDGLGDPQADSVHEFALFKGAIYAGTRNSVTGAQIWRSFDGLSFEVVVGPGAEVGGGFDYESTGAVLDLHVFDGFLYVGTINAFGGFGVYRTSNGTDWQKVGADGFGIPGNDYSWRYATYDGQLWLGTLNAYSFFGFPAGAGVWRSPNGVQWEELVGSPRATFLGWGFGDTNNIGTRTIEVYDGRLYFGTAQDSRPQVPREGLEIWRWLGEEAACPEQ